MMYLRMNPFWPSSGGADQLSWMLVELMKEPFKFCGGWFGAMGTYTRINNYRYDHQ